MQGIITEIQRFSLTDGPGIRTTVFLKGCNMRCEWCHNPETFHTEKSLMFYPVKCIGCGKCFEVCPQGAHQVSTDGKHIIDRELCVNCGKCAETCYAEALVMCGRSYTVDEVVREILQDKAYYETSGGGVTISGGEVLMQRDFVLELIRACKAEGIHTAIETNLSFPFESIEPLLREVDLIMCDLKLIDSERHKQYTGIGNEGILQNFLRCDDIPTPKIVRTPLIPGVTDTEENIGRISEFLRDRKQIVRYELLNFNPLGASKYDSLDMKNTCREMRPLDEAALKKLVARSSQNISTKVM